MEKYLMTGAELIGIREAQEVNKQRKVPKEGASKRKGMSKAKSSHAMSLNCI